MGSSRYIPWQRIRSWMCLRCGQCCKRFKIIITSYEYAKLSHYSESLVQVDENGNPVIRKVNGRCIAQDPYGLCNLQKVGMKPVACKIWPFTIFSNPKHRDPEALYLHEGEEYFVYVDRAYPCPGIDRGKPETLSATIKETVQIYIGRNVNQFLSTSRLGHTCDMYGHVVRMLEEKAQLAGMRRMVQIGSQSQYTTVENIYRAANVDLRPAQAKCRPSRLGGPGFIFGEVQHS